MTLVKRLLLVYFSFEVSIDSDSGSSGVHIIFVFVHCSVVVTQVEILYDRVSRHTK